MVPFRQKRVARMKKLQIEWAYGLFGGYTFHGMRINHGGSEIAVPRQLLDCSEVEVGLEQMTGEAVPRRVGKRSVAEPGLPEGLPDPLWTCVSCR
jgi:hypothetical protein